MCKVNIAETEMPTSVGITSVNRIFIHAALLRVLVLPAYMSLFLWQAPHAACLLTVTADAVPAHQRMRLHLSNRQTKAASLQFFLNFLDNFPFGPCISLIAACPPAPIRFPINESSPFQGRCAKRLLQMWQMC